MTLGDTLYLRCFGHAAEKKMNKRMLVKTHHLSISKLMISVVLFFKRLVKGKLESRQFMNH